MSGATVTMPMSMYDDMKKQIAEFTVEIGRLQELLSGERLTSGGNDRYAGLVNAMLAAHKIIGFAVSNLSPEFTKRWPYDMLRIVADGIKFLPDDGTNPLLVEFAAELMKFSVECEAWEARRKNTPERYVPPPNEPPSLKDLMGENPISLATPLPDPQS